MNCIQNTSYKALIQALAKEIKTSKNTIFQPEFIVGANAITQNYIKEQLVDENGIASNLKLMAWPQFTQMVFSYLKPVDFEGEYISKTKGTHLLFETFNQLDENEFKKVTNYFANDSRKRFGLAQKVYTLFDNYLKFNPSLLRGWDQAQLKDPNNEHEKWQAALWQLYRKQLKCGNYYDDYFVHQWIQYSVQSKTIDKTELANKVPSVHLVRMENATQAQIEFLQYLEKIIDVKIYALTVPSQKAGNLSQLWQGNQPILTQFLTPTNVPTLHYGSNSFLNQIQSKLIGEQAAFKLDSSIVIDGHYTTYREVEGLFNHLIRYFKKHPKAASRNMVVYCNDIKQYIPAIHYFFQQEKYTIPYRIFGDFTYEQNTSIHAIEALINYDKEALVPEELMSIIQMSAIANKFGFSSFEAIRNWINLANIREGFEGDTTIELDLISWKKGLNRLMLGSLTGCDATEDENYLLDVTEGNDFNELIALTHLIHLLTDFQLQTKTNRPLVDWVSLTTDFIENCIDTTYDQHFSLFIQYINQFDLTAKEAIPYTTWQLMMKAYFTEIPSIKRPGTNGVIFTELKNTQIIPADVSAVLGLNYNTFPRQQQTLGFDLLQNNKEMHYHRTKELDKFNLLQVLLQTTNQLYLSYQSHDPKSNKELPPSLVIEQIIDFSDNLLEVTHHPLHGFSTKYNQDNSNLYSYTQEATNTESIINQLSVLPVVEEEQANEVIIDLNEFTRYFQDSFKHFYNKKLGIYLDQEVNALPHHETLETNSLTDWKINNYFIDNDINYLDLSEEEKKEHIFQFKLSGDLPLHNLGNYYVDKALNKYEDVFINYFKFISDKTKTHKTIEYITEINDTKYIIKGSINLFDGQLIFPVFSSNTNKYKFEWILKSLILDLDESNSNILYLNSKKAFTIEQFKSDQIKSLITIENLVTKFISKNFNPFYLTFSSKEVTEFDSLKNNIMTDLFGNEYVVQLITKRVFQTDEALIQQFIKNQNLIHQLLTA